MSEEEIDKMKQKVNCNEDSDCNECPYKMGDECLLDLYQTEKVLSENHKIAFEKQTQNLHELEYLYQKEKEKNEKLIEGQVETIEKIIQPELFKKYISKNKIKELLEDVDKTPFINKHVKGQYLYDNLKMLLQEGDDK